MSWPRMVVIVSIVVSVVVSLVVSVGGLSAGHHLADARASLTAARAPSATVQLPPSVTLPGFGAINDITCPVTTFCLAADDTGQDAVYQNGGWSPLHAPHGFELLSCGSPGFCVGYSDVVGQPGPDETTGPGHLYVFNGSTWGPPFGLNPDVYGGSIEVGALSCPPGNSRTCMAITSDGHADTYEHGHWLTSHLPATGEGSGTSMDFPWSDGGLNAGLSCPSIASCLLVTSDGDAELSHGSWRVTGYEIGSGDTQSVSCPSAGACLDPIDGQVVNVTVPPPSDNVLSGVTLPNTSAWFISCTSAGICAAGGSGAADYLDLATNTVTPLTVPASEDFTAVSCPIGLDCVWGTATGQILAPAGTESPAVSSLSPDSTDADYPASISVTGTGLWGTATITLDGRAIPFVILTDTSLNITAPAALAHPGRETLTVTGFDGKSTAQTLTFTPNPDLSRTLAPALISGTGSPLRLKLAATVAGDTPRAQLSYRWSVTSGGQTLAAGTGGLAVTGVPAGNVPRRYTMAVSRPLRLSPGRYTLQECTAARQGSAGPPVPAGDWDCAVASATLSAAFPFALAVGLPAVAALILGGLGWLVVRRRTRRSRLQPA